MDLVRYLSFRRKQQVGDAKPERRHCLPLIASPINDHVLEWLSNNSSQDLEKTGTKDASDPGGSTSTLATSCKTSSGNPIIYKQHHEASTIELFYDLFFVGNLAYFTAMYQHTDTHSIINYLKLFTLMWFTWLATTLFDVRFSVDCVWNRINKAIQFGVFTGFVFAGPLFDNYNVPDTDRRAYKHFSLVLMVSRLAISAQYAVVMWQGRIFKQTLVPVGLSALVHACSALGFLIAHFVFPHGANDLPEQIVLFVISITEGLLIFLIAIIWRIISFKYTHIVERFELLTLIIIGEGIIGMVKSVACITKSSATNDASEFGTVTAAVLLLYLIWMLYFDQHTDDRFGTVRQQIWSLLHYPLHMAILLCVEGNTSLIVWNSTVRHLKWIWSMEPSTYSDPASGFSSSDEYLSYLNKTMYSINSHFKAKAWNTTYNWHTNLTAISNYTESYGFRSDDWNNKTEEVVNQMYKNAQVFVFEAHYETVAKLRAVAYKAADPEQALRAIMDVFNVTVLQFYVGAAGLLIFLAICYWFNKKHKTKHEFGEIINRLVFGSGLAVFGLVAALANKTVTGFKYKGSQYIIPSVVLIFFIVLALDNIFLLFTHHKSNRNSQQTLRNSKITTYEAPSGQLSKCSSCNNLNNMNTNTYSPYNNTFSLRPEDHEDRIPSTYHPRTSHFYHQQANHPDIANNGPTIGLQNPNNGVGVTLRDDGNRRSRRSHHHHHYHARSTDARSLIGNAQPMGQGGRVDDDDDESVYSQENDRRPIID